MLLLIITLLNLASSEVVPTAHAGVITAVGKQFFDIYKNVFLESFIANVEVMEFDSSSEVFPMFPHLLMNATISNISISNITFDKAGTVLDIQSAEP